MKDTGALCQYQTDWDNLVRTQQEESQDSLESVTIAKAAAFLKCIPAQKSCNLLLQVTLSAQGMIFAALDQEYQYMLYHIIDKKTFASIFGHMPMPARHSYYQSLSSEEKLNLLPYLSKKVRETILPLSMYPPETAGNLMSTDFATIFESMTVRQAMQKLKEDAPSQKMIYYLYVVDPDMHMKGVVSLKDLIMADDDDGLDQYLDQNFVFASIDEDQETLAERIEENSLIALPVLNADNQLVGIVSYESAIDIIRIEQTEDMDRFVGIVPNLSEDVVKYLTISSWRHFRKRWAWIFGLFAAGIVSTLTIQHYDHMLERITILALYLPMITATGGNIGSQTASVIIRALSIEQISLKDLVKIVIIETKIAFMLAMILCAIAFTEVILFSNNHVLLPHSIYRIAAAIGTALGIQIITSAVIGAVLPLIAKHFNGDPAVIASPAITSFVDITGIIIYFCVTITMLS
jgi:magnesium transporter